MCDSLFLFKTFSVPPTWKHIPKDIDALSGDPVVLNCEGSGTPKPTVTWHRSQGNNQL